MDESLKGQMKFCDYFDDWINVYKQGAVRDVTMRKYQTTLSSLRKIIPELKCCEMNRLNYQKMINEYAETHEKVTTTDFHHHVKAAVLDAIDEGYIERDPTRKIVIKGKQPAEKKIKYLNQYELHAVLKDLKLEKIPSMDWLILLTAKTGMRFSEALAITPGDFDFENQTIRINKTWGYKNGGGFEPTKNRSSVRTIPVDFKTVMQFAALTEGMPKDDPVFVKKGQKIYNSTANGILARHCKNAGASTISMHGLRHTHASLLLFQGVSIASVSKRLGHADITTTQNTYLHIMQELENKDTDLIMRAMVTLT